MSSATAEPTVNSLAAATEALRQAQTALAEVNERIDAGDPDVTADDVFRADTELRLARSRQDVAQRQAKADAERVRLERVAAIKEELATKLDPAPLERAKQKMAAAIEAYVAVCAEQDAARSDAWNELSSLGQPLPGVSLNGAGYGHITVGGKTYRHAPTQRGIAQVATEAVRRHYPRSEVRLGAPQD